MPWVDKEKCTGCGICVEKCPVDTIIMKGEKAYIEMDNCIRCGTCHSACPVEAVRHDGEKIPQDVEDNVKMVKDYMESCARYLGSADEKGKCLSRMKKYFNKEKLVAEKTLEKLEDIK